MRWGTNWDKKDFRERQNSDPDARGGGLCARWNHAGQGKFGLQEIINVLVYEMILSELNRQSRLADTTVAWE
jgi:hypothetical protein